MMGPRYAVYFAPDKYAPWREFGARWLGRDEYDNSVLPQPALDGMPPQGFSQITQEPRRYGFHATLKAPMRLAAGCDETSLMRRLNTLAATLKPVALGPLRVAALGDFVALVPAAEPAGLQALAAACVRELDDLRAPLGDADRARRRTDLLDARGIELLDLYGYPHVMERFRFHMTLTGPVDAATAQKVIQAVAPQVARLNTSAPLSLDRLCLFIERAPGEPFLRLIDLKLHA
jgi:putative phosphonate metabolism protein